MYPHQAVENTFRQGTFAPQIAPDGPRPVSGVEQRLDQMEKLLTGAHQRLSALSERLTLIARPQPPSGNGVDSAAARPILSPIAEKLESHCMAAQALVDRINTLLDSVDL